MTEVHVQGLPSKGADQDAYPPGLRWRILLSILLPVAWLSFTMLYVAFWASGFSLFQSVVVILVSLLILGGLLGAMWVAWGPRYGRSRIGAED